MGIKYPLEFCVKKGIDGGLFKIPFGGKKFNVIASHGGGWEHVSVDGGKCTPTWKEMCFIKSLFFDENDCVIQYHPPKSKYVNALSTCLHLWRPIWAEIPMPPIEFV